MKLDKIIFSNGVTLPNNNFFSFDYFKTDKSFIKIILAGRNIGKTTAIINKIKTICQTRVNWRTLKMSKSELDIVINKFNLTKDKSYLKYSNGGYVMKQFLFIRQQKNEMEIMVKELEIALNGRYNKITNLFYDAEYKGLTSLPLGICSSFSTMDNMRSSNLIPFLQEAYWDEINELPIEGKEASNRLIQFCITIWRNNKTANLWLIGNKDNTGNDLINFFDIHFDNENTAQYDQTTIGDITISGYWFPELKMNELNPFFKIAKLSHSLNAFINEGLALNTNNDYVFNFVRIKQYFKPLYRINIMSDTFILGVCKFSEITFYYFAEDYLLTNIPEISFNALKITALSKELTKKEIQEIINMLYGYIKSELLYFNSLYIKNIIYRTINLFLKLQ